MKKVISLVILCPVLMVGIALPATAGGNFGIGGGIYYNRMLGDIDKDDFDIDEDYFSYLLSLKYQLLDFVGVEALLDYYNGSGNVDYSLKPMATAVLGSFLNAGVGINKTYFKYKSKSKSPFKKDDWTDLSYHFKAGVQIPLGDLLWLNADVYYFLDELKDIEDFDKDYLTFGARVHFRF